MRRTILLDHRIHAIQLRPSGRPNKRTPANVVIVYAQTGLGYADRPGGPMPTISVSLQNLPFQFFFLRGLMGFRDLQIPASTVSTTAQDLASHAPSF